jgi:hypothetical protein
MVDYQFHLRYGAKSKEEDGAWEVGARIGARTAIVHERRSVIHYIFRPKILVLKDSNQ